MERLFPHQISVILLANYIVYPFPHIPPGNTENKHLEEKEIFFLISNYLAHLGLQNLN